MRERYTRRTINATGRLTPGIRMWEIVRSSFITPSVHRPHMDRRTLLQRTAPIAALGLAGCIGGDGGDGGDEGTDSPTESPTDDSTPEPTGSPTATDSPTDEPTDSPTPTDEQTATPASEPDQEVVVGPGGSLSFDPQSFEIAVGDTVLWTWDSAGHNVAPESVPDGSNWEGKAEEFSYGADATHSHTFEAAGEYEYVCQPHQSSGMVGSFTVTE
jgi:plastocyanin